MLSYRTISVENTSIDDVATYDIAVTGILNNGEQRITETLRPGEERGHEFTGEVTKLHTFGHVRTEVIE